jgi:hypothetical protein
MNKGTVSGWWMVIVTSIFLVPGLLPRAAMATHEADHRFTVYGYVRDDRGRPVKGERVIVVDDRSDQAHTAFTDGDGYYEALLHLHNQDMGNEITLMVRDEKKSIRATFDPEDKSSERKVQVDFGAPLAADEASVPAWKYGVAVLIVVGLVMTIRFIRSSKKSQRRAGKGSKQKR